MQPILSPLEQRLAIKLNQRVEESSLRRLDLPANAAHKHEHTRSPLDFSSNDYLGLAHSTSQHHLVESKYKQYTLSHPPPFLGSTGSRLLSGNSSLALQLETFLAKVHNRPAALVCNSGYDANLSILSSIPLPHDYIILDELAHNSLIMGMKMSRIQMDRVVYFRHNDVEDLKRILTLLKEREQVKTNTDAQAKINESGGDNGRNSCFLVVVESVYSMDGDVAPLKEILDLAASFGANVVVDEAHGLGVYGRTNVDDLYLNKRSFREKGDITKNGPRYESNSELKDNSFGELVSHHRHAIGGTGVLAALELENHPALLAAVFTFGKAAGCHGSVIAGSNVLIQYLVNYARPFVYSTSLPSHSLWTIKCAYDTMIGEEGTQIRDKVFQLVQIFRSHVQKSFREKNRGDTSTNTTTSSGDLNFLLPSPSPIQSVICRGNEHCIQVAKKLREVGGISVFPIRSPTVPKGEERIRIILHAHNTKEEVLHLVRCLVHLINSSQDESILIPTTLNNKHLISKL